MDPGTINILANRNLKRINPKDANIDGYSAIRVTKDRQCDPHRRLNGFLEAFKALVSSIRPSDLSEVEKDLV